MRIVNRKTGRVVFDDCHVFPIEHSDDVHDHFEKCYGVTIDHYDGEIMVTYNDLRMLRFVLNGILDPKA